MALSEQELQELRELEELAELEALEAAEKPPTKFLSGEWFSQKGEAIAENAPRAFDGISGVTRAPRALKEGVQALSLDAAQMAVPDATPVGQRLLKLNNQVRENIDDKRAADEAADPGSVAVGDIAAGLIPLPLGKGKAVTTLKGALARSSVEGAVGANLAYMDGSDRGLQTFFGAALPGIVQASSSFRGAIKNSVVRKLQERADKESQAVRAEAAAGFRDPNTGQPLKGLDDHTLAQDLGDPRVRRMSSKSVDVIARDQIRQQLNTRRDNVLTVMNNMDNARLDPEQRAAILANIVKTNHSELTTSASAAYSSGLKRLAKTPEGARMRVAADPIREAITELQKEFRDVPGILNKVHDAQLADYVDGFLKSDVKALKLGGLVEFKQVINKNREYGSVIADPSVRAAEKVRMRLMQAIESAVDQTPDTGAYRQLREVEGQYRQHMDFVRRVEADAITKLFGDKAILEAGPDAIYDRFIRLKPEEQKYGVQIIGKSNPEMLSHFRKRYLSQVLDDATANPVAAMQSDLNVETLYKGLTSDEMLKNPLFTAQEKAWARGAAKDIKLILNQLPDPGSVGTELTPEDLAINIVSHSGPFMARLAARAITGTQMEKILFTQEGKAALKATANVRAATDKQINKAIGYWTALWATEEWPEQGQEEQVEQ